MIPAHVKRIDSENKEHEVVTLDISLSGLCVCLPQASMPEIYEGVET